MGNSKSAIKFQGAPEDANLMRNNSLNASKPVNAYLLPTFDVTIPVVVFFQK